MKKTKTFNVVLCGPGDVAKEITIAKEVVAEWNWQNGGLSSGLKFDHWTKDRENPACAVIGHGAASSSLQQKF